MYKDTLEKAGLRADEALLYDLLLQIGSSPAKDITSKTTLKRGMVYKTLNDLKIRGLVSINKKNKKTYFSAEHPNIILSQIDNKLQEAKLQKETIEAVLPSLETKYKLQEIKPTVTYYEGLSGIKKIFQDIYSPKGEPVYGCVDLEKSDSALPGAVMTELIPLRIKNKLFAYSLVADSEQGRLVHSKDASSYRISKLLDKSKYPLPAEIDVYEDKVAMLSFDKEQFVGILIENKDIATSLKTVFKLAFENTKPEVTDSLYPNKLQ